MKKHFLMLATGLGLASCGNYEQSSKPEYTVPEAVNLIERGEDGNYKLKVNEAGTWKIFAGTSLNQVEWNNAIGTVKGNGAEEFVYTPTASHDRPFFALTNGTDTLYTSNRSLYLDNAINFRDIGGLKTTDGRYVKWGKIFRSAELKDLSDEDKQSFKDLHIKTIVDLRSDKEIEEAPDDYPENAGIHWIHNPLGVGNPAKMDSLFDIIRKADPESNVGADFMVDANRNFPTYGQECVKTTFDILLNNETPMVFHCTAGKDRTGYTSALILSALGVDRETITQEYLASNYYRFGENESSLKKAAQFYGIDHRVLRPMMDVRKEYIQAAFDVIDNQYGGVENYLKTEIGLTDNDLQALRNQYLY